MKPKLEVIQSVLLRNNYTLTKDESDVYTLRQAKVNSQEFNLFYFFEIAMIVGGIILLLLGSMWGLVLIALTIPIFMKVSKQKYLQKANFNRKINFARNLVELVNGDEKQSVTSIKEINYSIEEEKDLSIGSVLINFDDEGQMPLIELFGNNKKYVEDDAQLIAEFVHGVVFGV